MGTSGELRRRCGSQLSAQSVRRRGLVAHGVRESDWKTFRELREAALDRVCRRILEEVTELTQDGSRSHHERYRALWSLLRDRDEDVARAFDDPRRSRMLWQLAAIHHLGLLEPEEFERLHAETRETVESLSKELLR
jgi:hypothetical protein